MRQLLPSLTGRKPRNEPVSAPINPVSASAPAADTRGVVLELSRELLRGLEQFVVPTPDLDAVRFLEHLRQTAALLLPDTDSAVIEAERAWAKAAIPTFGQVQRRYLADREEELWNLVQTYQEAANVQGVADSQFNERIRESQEKVRESLRLDDLRQVREQVTVELHNTLKFVDEKSRQDEERSNLLLREIQQLQNELHAVKDQASRDTLTGVYHRGGFEGEIERLLQAGQPVSLAIVDLDNFKGINDTFGHQVGDEILKLAVSVLRRCARQGDLVGRFGGDEFVMAAPRLAATQLASRLRSAMSGLPPTEFTLNGQHYCVRLSLSVGVAESKTPDTLATLLKRADDCLYGAKQAGKGRVHVAE